MIVYKSPKSALENSSSFFIFAFFQRSNISPSSSLELFKNPSRILMAPKQRAGKEVSTSAMASSHALIVEKTHAGKGFSLFYLFRSQILAISR